MGLASPHTVFARMTTENTEFPPGNGCLPCFERHFSSDGFDFRRR